MNRSLAAIAAAAMLAASVPSVGFADETSSNSSSSVSSESSSSVQSESSTTSASSSSKGWKKPCEELTGLLKAQCIVRHNPGRGNKKDGVQRRNDERTLNRVAKCDDKEGAERIQCIRKKSIKTLIKKAGRHEIKRTIRGKVQDESSSESSED